MNLLIASDAALSRSKGLATLRTDHVNHCSRALAFEDVAEKWQHLKIVWIVVERIIIDVIGGLSTRETPAYLDFQQSFRERNCFASPLAD